MSDVKPYKIGKAHSLPSQSLKFRKAIRVMCFTKLVNLFKSFLCNCFSRAIPQK